MRGGGGISCVVNSAAGRELDFANPSPPKGERIAVIGAGPAGLTYASLVADDNDVTVFDKARRAGGSFRFAGLAPMFQEVEANPASLERYIRDMEAACRKKGVRFRFSIDVIGNPDLVAPFDRIVVATGASYPYGAGPWAMALLDLGAGTWPGVADVMRDPRVRDWFYYRLREPTADRFRGLVNPDQILTVIGDAAKPGKSKEAIASAFEAALLDK
jgi:hypothetical protein